jgi:hypothetical protein
VCSPLEISLIVPIVHILKQIHSNRFDDYLVYLLVMKLGPDDLMACWYTLSSENKKEFTVRL